MLKFLLGAFIGFYIGSIGITAYIAKINTFVDSVQEWSTNATK